MSKVIAVSNQKGGVGKTVSCEFRDWTGKRRKTSIADDADPQGSMTISLGYSEPEKWNIACHADAEYRER